MPTRLMAATFLLAMMSAPSWGLAARKPVTGDQVEDFAFRDFNGQMHRLSDYSGHYVLLDFWATWCGPCLKEVPVLRKAAELYRKRGLEILGMNSDQKVEKARNFLEKSQISWPQSNPESTKQIVDRELGVKWYPAIILIDPQRRILFISGNGSKVLNGKKLLEKLDETLPTAPHS